VGDVQRDMSKTGFRVLCIGVMSIYNLQPSFNCPAVYAEDVNLLSENVLYHETQMLC
jgi:hypothetical protein